MLRLGCFAVAFALALGCAPAADAIDPEIEPRQASAKVVGGAPEATRDAVVAVLRADGATCSGVVVADHVVLTAGHCLFGAAAADFEIRVGADATTPTRRLPVARIVPYPTAAGTSEDELGGVDLAALVTRDALPVAPLPLALSIEDADLQGHVVTAVGYGRTVAADPSSVGRRFATEVAAASVCSRVFRVGDDVTNVCFGDSGGAVLLDGAVVGLVSGGLDGCKTPSVVTRLRAHRVWLERIVAGSFDAACPECVGPDSACHAPIEVSAAPPGGASGGGCAIAAPTSNAVELAPLLLSLALSLALFRFPRRTPRRNRS